MSTPLYRIPNRLRFKIVIAAVTMFVLVSLVGWIGLSYTKLVANVVTRTTEIHVPLLANAVAASNAMRRLTFAARDILIACDHADGSHRAWLEGTLSQEFSAINNLADFLKSTGNLNFEQKVRSATAELKLTINNLSRLCDIREGLQTQFNIRRLHALSNIEEFDKLIASIQNIEGSTTSASAPGANDPGQSIPEPIHSDYQSWQAALHMADMRIRLARFTGYLEQAHSNQVLKGTTSLTEQLMELKALRYELIVLMPQLIRLGHPDAVTRMDSLMSELSDLLKKNGGLHNIWRRVRLFDSGTAAQKMMASRAEIALSSVLKAMESDARTRYDKAIQTVESQIRESLWVTGTVAVISAILFLIASVIIASRLIRPMEQLTAHVEQLRLDDELESNTPDSLMQREDEIGALARSFDLLIVELSQTRRQLLRESRENIRIQYDRLSAAIESSPQGLCLTDAKGRILMFNSHFLRLYDLQPEQITETMSLRKLLELLARQGAKWLEQPDQDRKLTLAGLTKEPLLLDFRNERTIVVRTADTPEGGLVSVHEDITERRRQEEKIAHLAHHDNLTGLPNRTLFREQLIQAQKDLVQGQELALLVLDLDDFKSVNDSLGHPVGDRLLIQVSERLNSCLMNSDKVARLGGDEFAIFMTEDASTQRVIQTAENIIDSLHRAFKIDRHAVIIGVSIGVAVSPRDATDTDVLIKCADIALFRAKADGRNSYCFFESEMDTHIQTRRALEMDLRHAVENNDLELYYQPQIGFGSKQIEGFEALIRWNHPNRGFISPQLFITLAEEIGLIDSLGKWVLRRACEDALQWPESITIAVNLSPIQFRNKGLLDDIRNTLAATGLNPGRLELEITEGVLLENSKHTQQLLETLRNLGVQTAMDDFGTGYSSLSYLRRFHFDKVKIDRSFVSAMDTSSDDGAVVHAICDLCHSLGMKTIAEGVETAHQYEILQQASCTQWQGFYCSKAVPLSETLALIARGDCSESKSS